MTRTDRKITLLALAGIILGLRVTRLEHETRDLQRALTLVIDRLSKVQHTHPSTHPRTFKPTQHASSPCLGCGAPPGASHQPLSDDARALCDAATRFHQRASP